MLHPEITQLPSTSFKSLVQVARTQAYRLKHQQAFCFLRDGEVIDSDVSFYVLDQRARAIASALQAKGVNQNDRVLLLLPNGTDFIEAYFGCLYAGAIAVPAFPPQRQRHQQERLTGILQDATPVAALSLDRLQEDTAHWLADQQAQADLLVLSVDRVSSDLADNWVEPLIDPNQLAMLQYTSGSTGSPKGVMVSHQNLITNCQQIIEALALTESAVYLSWLPLFHDLGLISGVLTSHYLGVPHSIMTPAAFLQKPIRWLQAISATGATVSGGPNFAFELCADRATAAQKAELDLSSWSRAFSGAEPINHSTLTRFADTFASSGFRRRALYPSYGLAESTLFVTGGVPGRAYNLGQARDGSDTPSLMGLEKIHVSLGSPRLDQHIVICNLDSGLPCPDGEVGEIWLQGSNVAKGYWGKTQATQDTFQVHLANGEGPFLRTGDLGFLKNGELYITGRHKDLLIIHGTNYYPQDIEAVVEGSHPAIRRGATIAFALANQNQERPAIVTELSRQGVREKDFSAVANSIRDSIRQHFQLEVCAVVLLKPMRLPKTSSGKLKRSQCKEAYLQKKIDGVFEWADDADIAHDAQDVILHRLAKANPEKQQEYLIEHLVSSIARLLCVDPKTVSIDSPINGLGLNSLATIQLSDELANVFGTSLNINDLFDCPSLTALAEQLSTATKASQRKEAPVSLSKSSHQTTFPLTDIQQAYWLGRHPEQVLGGNSTHAYFEYDITGIDCKLLTQALNKTIAQHPMLRAVVTTSGQQTIIEKVPEYFIKHENIAAEVSCTDKLEEKRELLAHQLLDCYQWPLFDIQSTQLDENTLRLHVHIDMLIADGWSIQLFLNAWENNLFGTGAQVGITFADYIAALKEIRTTNSYQQAKTYWLDRLGALPPPPKLPYIKHAADIEKPKHFRLKKTLSSNTWQALKERCQDHNMTPSGLLLAAYGEVLGNWSENERFSVNVTLFNRPAVHQEINNIIGDFTSLNYFAMETNYNHPFSMRAKHTQTQLFDDLSHRQFSGVEVLRALKQEISNPFIVFTSLLGLNAHPTDALMQAFGSTPAFAISQTSQSCLDNVVWEEGEALHIAWDFVKELFCDGVVDAMFNAYIAYLESLVDDDCWARSGRVVGLPPAQSLNRIKINDTYLPTKEKTLPELIREAIETYPTNIAVIEKGKAVTFEALGRRALGIAQTLLAEGVKQNTVVPIVLSKSTNMIAAILGVHFAGAAYAPIDPAWPFERQRKVLKQLSSDTMITSRDYQALLEVNSTIIIENVKELHTLNWPSISTSRDDLAYVLFTSGTTGEPKGVMIPHAGAVNTVSAVNQKYQINEHDRAIALSAFTFDLSVYDIFGLLSVGGCLVLPDEAKARDPEHWLSLVVQHRVSVWNSVPAMVNMAVDYLGLHDIALPPSLNHIFMSGDFIPTDLPGRIRSVSSNVNIISLGGPTETSIWCVDYPIQNTDIRTPSVPYGQPLPNQRLYILRDDGSSCPDWVSGEMFIAGDGLAHGYWRDEEKTNAQFILHAQSGQRLYKSGDFGRIRSDGLIEIEGRRDNQVKINGYRIELGEVEAALLTHDSVKASVAIVVKSATEQAQIHAFVVIKDEAPAALDLQSWVVSKVPSYMVPTQIHAIDALPLSSNGKIDRSQLLPKSLSFDFDNDVQLTDQEQTVAKIWASVIGEAPQSRDQAWSDLGGNSLLAVKATHLLNQQFNVQLSISTLYIANTVAKISKEIDKHQQRDEQASGSSLVKVHDILDSKYEEAVLKLGPVDAVALAYFPDELADNGDRDRLINETIGQLGDNSLIDTVWDTHHGRIARLVLPIWGHELVNLDTPGLRKIEAGLAMAKDMGAKSVCLTGILPRVTEEGRALMARCEVPQEMMVTTGKTIIAAAGLLATESILGMTHRPIENESVAFLGLGGTGLLVLEMFLQRGARPAVIRLFDHNKRSLEEAAQLINRYSNVLVEVVANAQAASLSTLVICSQAYDHDFSVDSLLPGTLWVDRSAPVSLNAADALMRMQSRADILVTDGSVLLAPKPTNSRNLVGQWQMYNPAHGSLGCVMASILALDDGIGPTLDGVTADLGISHVQKLLKLGYQAPRPQLNGTPLDQALVDCFCRHFGG